MSFVVRKLQLAEEDILQAAIWYEEKGWHERARYGLGESPVEWTE